MQFTQVSNWNIPEGEVIRVTDSLNRVIWEKETPKATDYFWIKDVSGSNNTVTIKKNQDSSEHWITPTITVYYSTDQINWTSMGSTSTTGITVTIPANTKVYFRATADTWSSTNTNYHNFFDISGNCTVGGNVMSLIYGNNFANQTAFPNDSRCNLAEILAGNPITNASLLILPATTLTERCYYSMFMNCYNLVAAPELPATTLATSCYQLMFANCHALNNITTYADNISATNCLSNWLQSVAATGTFNNMGSATYILNSGSGIPAGWTVHNYVPFYVEDISGSNNTLSITKTRDVAPTFEVFYSTDRTNWTSMGNTDTTAITATIPANGKLYLKANTNQWGNASYAQNAITASGSHNVGGNAMSLIYGDNFENQTSFPYGSTWCLGGLFYGNNTLISASNLKLPATTLVESCYEMMFMQCTSLTTIPADLLPATTLAEGCYAEMFQYCSITTTPVLPATTLADYCYYGMFVGCSSLNSVATYANDISASDCFAMWLYNVSATGDFYNYGNATYPSGANGIPGGWIEHTS